MIQILTLTSVDQVQIYSAHTQYHRFFPGTPVSPVYEMPNLLPITFSQNFKTALIKECSEFQQFHRSTLHGTILGQILLQMLCVIERMRKILSSRDVSQ